MIYILSNDPMTLEEAYEITNKMTGEDHRNPTPLQREAKEVIYKNTIKKQYGDDIPPHLEPDFLEGWK